jgi:signal peptidase I
MEFPLPAYRFPLLQARKSADSSLYTPPGQSYNYAMRQPKQQSLWFHVLDVVFNIVVIVTIVAGIRTFLVSPFQVEGNSMVPTLVDEEYIIINKLAYHVGSPGRGDIVVFRPPNDPKKYYVKRVIGLPGDEVILREGNVYVREGGDGPETQLAEGYLDERNAGHTFRHPAGVEDGDEARYTVPGGSYFLLGDNRLGSLDSRGFTDPADSTPTPFVAEEQIKGRVWFVALPITKIHAFEAPEYDL